MTTPHILYFTLPQRRAALPGDGRHPLRRALRAVAHDLDGDTLITARMLDTAPPVGVLRTYMIEHDVTAEYSVWITRAQPGYDGAGTLALTPPDPESGERTVAVLRTAEVWQLPRYASGGHDARPTDTIV